MYVCVWWGDKRGSPGLSKEVRILDVSFKTEVGNRMAIEDVDSECDRTYLKIRPNKIEI